MSDGGCHCGAVRYTVEGEPAYSALCHCRDCTKSAGALMVGWALFPRDAVTIMGTTTAYKSSEQAERHFCGVCGTGLFYTNADSFPGQIDIQIATLDDPDDYPATGHVQVADDPEWMKTAYDLPQFERYPG